MPNNEIGFKSYIVSEVFSGRGRLFPLRLIKSILMGSLSSKLIVKYRVACYLKNRGCKFFSNLILKHIARTYGVYIGYNTNIGIGLKMPHPNGIVIGEGVTIGEYCTIFQQVTLGGARLGDGVSMNYPTIGNNVVLYAGAKVLGKINIGDKVVIGANAVVTKDVPESCISVGVPARNKRKAID